MECLRRWIVFPSLYLYGNEGDLYISLGVGIMAESLGRDARDVYRLMQKGNIIMGYIVPCFDVLHSFSREYIIEDLTRLMKNKGLLAA